MYVRDSGITHALLDIHSYNNLLGHPISGKSWEGFVIENIISVLQQNAQVFYYRSAGGAEIDLVIEFNSSDREIWAIEIKRSASTRPGRGFYEACNDIQPNRKFIIHAEEDAFPLNEGIEVIGLYGFLNLLPA